MIAFFQEKEKRRFPNPTLILITNLKTVVNWLITYVDVYLREESFSIVKSIYTSN